MTDRQLVDIAKGLEKTIGRKTNRFIQYFPEEMRDTLGENDDSIKAFLMTFLMFMLKEELIMLKRNINGKD